MVKIFGTEFWFEWLNLLDFEPIWDGDLDLK